MSLSVLLVDDEVEVTCAISRMLTLLQPEWTVRCSCEASVALEMMKVLPVNVVVSDMRMPSMQGDEFLEEVRKRFPATVRILLTGQSDNAASLRSIGPAHQFLTKPCNPELLIHAISDSDKLRRVLCQPELVKIVGGATSLPSAPSLYTALVRELDGPNSSVRGAANIISKDVGMTAEVLKIVNSSFFGLARTTTSPLEAVSHLGIETLKSIVAFTDTFGRFEALEKNFPIEALQSHSLQVAQAAKRVCTSMGCAPDVVNDAFLAGLLHDSGKLVLASQKSSEYAAVMKRAKSRGLPVHEAERLLWGSTHAEAGAFLLSLWGLPDRIVEAVAYHHRPEMFQGQPFGLTACIYLANLLVNATLEEDADTRLTDAFEPYGLNAEVAYLFGDASKMAA